MTQAELEELIVTKRRAEGTPCNKENFNRWLKKFDEEMIQYELDQKELLQQQGTDNNVNNTKKSAASTSADEIKKNRLTGYQYFSDKTNQINYEALEAAAERAGETQTNDDGDDDVDEDLFDDDVDLDDLDFDDDDDEDDDDDNIDI